MKKYQPDEKTAKQVEAMASYGIPQKDIAAVIGTSIMTLEKYYRNELDQGSAKATAMVAQNLYRMATGTGREAVTAAIFWMKCRGGWKEKHAIVGGDEGDRPVETVIRWQD